MNLRKRLAAACSATVVVVAAVAAAAPVQASTAVKGYVYVNDNTASANTISVLARHADGSAAAVGAAVPAGGAGSGDGLPSQGALQFGLGHRFLLAVDAGSNQISVLRVHGAHLVPVTGSPFPSGGVRPVSIAVHGHLVYVANAGAGGSNYTGFRLADSGRLTPIAESAYALPDDAQPGQVLFNPTGTRVIGTRVNTSVIDSFTVSGGRLTPAAGSPFAAQGVGPFGSEFSPVRPNLLFVSNAHNGANLATVSAFHDGPGGVLQAITGSPFADRQTAACWVEVSHDGRYVFAVNTAVPSISSYRVTSGGGLALIGSTVFNQPSGLGPVDARLAPDGKTLWVVDSGAAAVSTFAVSGGHLREVATSPVALPTGSVPFGIVVS